MSRNPGRTSRPSRRFAAWLLLALASLALSGAGAPPHQCRFWGLVGVDYPGDLITDQLRDGSITNLRALGGANPDGWGFVWYPPAGTETPLALPVARRGGPRADDPNEPDFLLAVDELDRVRPRAALGHVRQATSGHTGIPDPHPFQRLGMSFAHNGVLSASALRALLSDYLPTHPLDYYEGMGTTGPIDSELYFVFLLKYAEEHPELSFSEALRRAVYELATNPDVTAGYPRLNFVMTDGDTLYALSYYSANDVRYYPNLARSGGESSYWVAASEKMGSHVEGWGTIPTRTLAVFVPNRAPVFLPITAPPTEAPVLAAPEARPVAPPDAGDSPPEHNCRLWGLIGSGYPVSLIQSELRDGTYQNLRRLSATNNDGWGLGYFPAASYPLPLTGPIVRRGGPAADNPYEPEYSIAVDEMTQTAPVAAVAHVRAATSGHSGIPNPHPFQQRGMLFAHNGGLNTSGLLSRLGDYLTTHPPDYKPGTTGTGYIDSELYFLYLLKLVDDHAGLAFGDALPLALQTLIADPGAVGASPALNFVLTDGDTLYAFNYYGLQPTNLLQYYPATGPERSDFWAVASEPLGNSDAGWGPVPPRTLAVFVPGQAPIFHALGDPGRPPFTLADVAVTPLVDADGDGWASALRVCCDPNADWGQWSVSLELAASVDGTTWSDLVATRYFTIDATAPDETCVTGFVAPDTLGPTHWHLRLQLREQQTGEIVATATRSTDPILGNRHVEGAARDTVPDLPRAFRLTWAGVADPVDLDADGFVRSFTLRWHADLTMPTDSAWAYVAVSGMEGMRPVAIGRSAPFLVRGTGADTVSFPITVEPRTRQPAAWDLYLELYDSTADTLAARAGPTDFPALAGVGVEGARADELEPPPPDTLGIWVDTVRPNPAPGEMRIPVRFNLETGTTVTLEIWDVTGRIVWREGPIARAAHYADELHWRGESLAGGRVGSGVFFCRVRVGGATFKRRVVMVR